MQKLSEALSRDGDPCPFIVVEGPECRGILKYVNVIKHINILSDYTMVHECDTCKRKVYDLVDTEDGRVELLV